LIKAVTQVAEMIGTSEGLSRRLWPLLAAGLAMAALGLLAPDPKTGTAALMTGMTLVALASVLRGFLWLGARSDRQMGAQLADLLGQDAAPCFTTDATGVIGYQNASARARFGPRNGATLIATLQDHFASPPAVLFRLQCRADSAGAAREDVVTRRGHTRLSVHRISPERFLWRLEEFQDRPGSGRGAENLSLPMLVANKAGVVLFSNDAMRRLTGGRPKHLDRLFTDMNPKTGQEVNVTTANGAVRAFFAEVDGMGERREIYLLPAEDRSDDSSLVTDFDTVPVALIKFAPDGGMRHANRAAVEMLALEAVHPAGVTQIFEGLGRSAPDWLADVAAGRLPGGSEVLRLRRSGEDRFVQVTLRRLVEDGRVSVLAVLNDATAFKTLEAQFAQSQKMQAIGQLAGGIAHDFNNLLTAISGHCDLLLLRHDRDDPEYADLVQINQNANRAAALVGQLLAFSRKQTLKPERVEVHEVLADLSHLLNRLVGERVALRVSHAAGLGPIRADKRQLEQVIMNLVVNARDAMPSGGTIRIETEAVTLATAMERDRARVPAGNYAVIRVLDTGCGIAPDRLTKVFEPFYTTKRVGEGTGLGLSMAYGIVKQSGGFIFCDSEVGLGTAFHLYFPINSTVDEPKVAVAPTPRPLIRQGHGVILLVEDEAPVRAFASRALRLRGYTVLEAGNAEEALKTLEDPALEVDIFVTDVVMPGMDGPSWVKMALEMRPDVRVVFVSGYAEDVVAEDQARIPNSVFLPKPFSLTDLTDTVQGQLH
jgi:two-component system, cell cycle sensor histidine kinase and response regulator CckA